MRTILIVDDQEINRIILKGMLEKEYNIIEAADGSSACALLEREYSSVSAVLLDIVMVGMDGYEVLKHIRGNSETSQIPVIMLTGSVSEDTKVKSLALGANDFILKPYNEDIIKHCLSNAIALREVSAQVNILKRDRLTGLYNREAFFEKAEQMIAEHEAGYYVMACFDIDKFKVINDQYGTVKGDEVLKNIAEVFRRGFEPNGAICCRIYADNFAVLYPSALVSTDMLQEISRTAGHVEGIVFPIVFSIGRYIVENTSLSASAMYDRAFLAANTVKGQYDAQSALYDESMRGYLIVEQEIVNEMVSALESNQFEAWYQPQYNHCTGALVGSEALARWRHPEKGLIPPYKFIPVFEQNGFVYELDKFIWEDVCRHLRKWSDEGRHPLPVSVNISRYDIFRDDLVDVISGLLEKYSLPVELLRLEITESAFSESAAQIISVVKKLIDLGFTVEIDDFGSGYSSLNTLKDVPAQVLKLDMKFLESSDNTQRGGNIVESIVRMAKWLDMAIIAEGVETVEQADFLKSIGCSYIQGYLYSKPIPAADYEALCKDAGKEERMLVLETVETLDNNAFWDPASMDTLIFNSFVGGACIFEYSDGKIEMLRATDKYAQVISNGQMTVEAALKIDWMRHLTDESRKSFIADIEISMETQREFTGEYVFTDLPHCPHETYLRSSIRVIAKSGGRSMVYCTTENITAQRIAERREHELAEEMRLIMTNVNGGICAAEYLDGGGVRIIFANDTFYSMYGYTREQFETELSTPLDAIVPEDRERTVRTVMELAESRGCATYEYRCKRRDGSIINICCNNSVTSFDDVSDRVLLSVTTDTTELLHARENERRTAQQLRTIMSNMNSGFSVLAFDENGKGHIVFANDKYYTMFGYTREQVATEQNYFSKLVHPEDYSAAQKNVFAILSDHIPRELEYRCVKRDGSVIYVRGNKSVASVEGYGGDMLISVVTDVTALVETEQKAERLSNQLQSIMDNVDQGITATIVKDENADFIFANNRYFEMLGYTREQYINEVKNPFVTIAPEDRERAVREISKINTVGKSNVLEFSVLCRDKTVRFFRIAVSVAKFADTEAPVQLAIYRDITSEKSIERELLDNLPYGAALYEFDGSELTVVHINKSYWQWVKRNHDGAYQKSFLNVLHPDDKKRLLDALNDAVLHGTDYADNLRILCGESDYETFRVVGKIVPRQEGKYAIYTSYMPIMK